jgi:hypothetical protein
MVGFPQDLAKAWKQENAKERGDYLVDFLSQSGS